MKTITIGAHARDCFWMGVKVTENVYFNYDGYVPNDMCIGGGDDVEMEIDVETGTIIGWDKEKVKAKLEMLKLETEE